jgi:hypothetical protein
MKRTAPGNADAATCLPSDWFLGICLAAFLAIYASSTVAKAGAGGLNPAEEWVIARVTAVEDADLSQQFSADKDRKLSAHFPEDLVTGTLPRVKLYRHDVRITGAVIDEPVYLANAQIPCEVWLKHCQFNENVTFARASSAGKQLCSITAHLRRVSPLSD